LKIKIRHAIKHYLLQYICKTRRHYVNSLNTEATWACIKAIGEIEFDSTMTSPLCGQCSSIEEKIHDTVKYYQDNFRMKIAKLV
jgi:hypothetical protein